MISYLVGPRLPGLTLTLIRVVLGLFWLSQVSWKAPPTFGCPDQGFCLWVNLEIQHPLIPLYAEMLEILVKPYVILVGWVTFVVETLIGVSLVFGILTRLGGLVGALWAMNLLIGLSAVPGETSWTYVWLMLLNLLFFGVGSVWQPSVDRARAWTHWFARAELA